MTAQERAHLKHLVDQRTRTLKLDGLCPVCVENRVKEGRMYCGRGCAVDAKRLLSPMKSKPITGWGSKVWAKELS